MSKITKYVGLDVHKDSISIAVAVKYCVVQGLENTSSPDAAPRVQFDN